MHHLASEYGNFNDLLDTCSRLRELGIKPHMSIDHGIGQILPAPGSEADWFAKLPHDMQQRLRTLAERAANLNSFEEST